MKETDVFSQEVLDRANSFCCYRPDELDCPFPPGSTVEAAIDAVFEEGEFMACEMSALKELIICAFDENDEDEEKYPDGDYPAFAQERILVYVGVRKITEEESIQMRKDGLQLDG